METIAVAGVGLIGGSFALALRAAGFDGRIIGVSSPATISTALARGAIDEGAEIAEAASRADVVFLATPIGVILEQLASVDAHVRPGTLITDAGSTKAHIVAHAAQAVRRGRFLGGHPMAGKERSGIDNADADLFRDRPWAFCQPESELTPAESEFVEWVRKTGARPVFFTPEEHDRAVAFSSHLPQLVSTALAASIGRAPGAFELAGPGMLDMTRLAGSPYSVWRDIIATNEGPITEALGIFLAKMAEMSQGVSQHDLSNMFETSKNVILKLRSR